MPLSSKFSVREAIRVLWFQYDHMDIEGGLVIVFPGIQLIHGIKLVLALLN